MYHPGIGGGVPVSYLQRADSCVVTLVSGNGVKCNVCVHRLSQ
jgi:hypothetical protein